jgi:alkylation response protein AidB-like acyl-CoA dehydrogenase
MDVLGADGLLVDRASGGEYEMNELRRIFMASRAETVYAGSSEIQHNIIGERVLGLPRPSGSSWSPSRRRRKSAG